MEVIYSMKTKVLALLLVLLLLVPCVLAACSDDKDTGSDTSSGAASGESSAAESSEPSGDASNVSGDTSTKDYDMPEQDAGVLDEDWNKVVIGDITELSGDFRFPGYGSGTAAASDLNINGMTVGYGTMELDRYGTYQWNTTVVASHTEEEDADGNLVITIEIKPGLKFSDGSEVKAVNYLAYLLAYSSPVVRASKHPGVVGQTFVGFSEFYEYAGEEEGYSPEGTTKEFSGLRLLGDYKFSMTISKEGGFYPYYYAETYGAVSPYPLDLILGTDADGNAIEVKDDGNGAYLSEEWYAKTKDSAPDAPKWVQTAHVNEARWDVSKYAYSGPYVISEWDSSTKEATLKVNKNYAGNWEGQKPPIGTIVYTKVVQETQMDALQNGQVDVLTGLTDADAIKKGIELADTDGYDEYHYDRAGYGKIQFDCDFSPTMFTEVRQAISYILDKNEFAQTFTGGYGTVVYGPYAVLMPVYQAVKDDLQLDYYDFSVANAKKVLEEGGWVYNSKGEAYTEGGTGIDSVRYKKLEGEDQLTDANINYTSVQNADGITYKTVQVGDDYYMPLVINWFGSEGNSVSDLLNTMLVNGEATKEIGMVIRNEVGEFTALTGQIYRDPEVGYSGTPTYSMYNLATGWTSSIYDYSWNWSLDPNYFDYSVNKWYDPYDKEFPYAEHTGLSYDEAMEQSGGKLGMDYLSMAMVYTATTEEEYNQWWKAYIERWNYLEPDIPLYGNIYYDLYNSKIEHFQTSAYFGASSAILYCTVKKPS